MDADDGTTVGVGSKMLKSALIIGKFPICAFFHCDSDYETCTLVNTQ